MINAHLNIHLNPSLILSLRVFDSVQISSYSYYSSSIIVGPIDSHPRKKLLTNI